MLVGDAADQRLGALQDRARDLDGHVGAPWMSIRPRAIMPAAPAAWRLCEVWRAIISSSLVGITHAETRLAGGADARPAGLRWPRRSSSTPSQAASRQTRSRIAGACSPMPAVKTSASMPAGGGGQRAQLAADAVDEQLDREARALVVARQQRPHVARDARDAEQPRLLVDQVLDGARIHAELVHQVEDHARDRDCRSACPSAGRRRR